MQTEMNPGIKESKILKLGILGCSSIVSRAIINPLAGVDSILAYGIASRNRENAVVYAEKYGITNVYDSYQALLQVKEIDFVYIALPNFLHKEWTIKAATAGKHILVEKPLCINISELVEMEEACKKNQVCLLEGLMVRHHPWQEFIKNTIQENKYGKLLSTESILSFLPKDNFIGNYRSYKEKGGGAFYDLASYWIQFLQCIGDINQGIYDGNSEFKGPNGCDWTFWADFIFKDGCSSHFTASFERPYQARHELKFETAIIKVDDYFRANLGNYKINIFIENLATGKIEKISFPPQCYYSNQLVFFREVITGKKPNIEVEDSHNRLVLLENIYQKAWLKVV